MADLLYKSIYLVFSTIFQLIKNKLLFSYLAYHTMYIVGPGESAMIEANPDAIGLKLGIIYQTEKERNELLFHRFTCNNDSFLTITLINGENITYFGGIIAL
jgi:hypothetical protein